MKKYIIISLLILTSSLFYQCKKDDDNSVEISTKDYLTAHPWKISKTSDDYGATYENIEYCRKDNLIIFSDGIVITTVGEIDLCSDEHGEYTESESTEKYTLSSDEKIISIGDDAVMTINSIDENKLILQEDEYIIIFIK